MFSKRPASALSYNRHRSTAPSGTVLISYRHGDTDFGTALADRRRPERTWLTPISPGSILARRREAKPAARVQTPALASPVPPVRGPAYWIHLTNRAALGLGANVARCVVCGHGRGGFWIYGACGGCARYAVDGLGIPPPPPMYFYPPPPSRPSIAQHKLNLVVARHLCWHE